MLYSIVSRQVQYLEYFEIFISMLLPSKLDVRDIISFF